MTPQIRVQASVMVTTGLDDLEYAYELASRAEDIRADRRETRHVDDLMADLGITRGELDTIPDEPA